MNRSAMLRVIKIFLIVCALYIAIDNISEIEMFYWRRMTPYAERVFNSIKEVNAKLLSLRLVHDPDLIVSTFEGVLFGRMTSKEIQDLIPAEKSVAEIIPQYAEPCYYECYRIPAIEDYAGVLIMRFDMMGSLIEYKIQYEGDEI